MDPSGWVEQGGTLALAAFSIYMLNQVWKLRLEEVKRYAEELKSMNCEMRNVISRNTQAWLKMLERSDDSD
jgi:hypothetical protein